MNNCLFVAFSRIFLLVILIFKRITARRLYKSFGVKGLKLISADRYVAVTLIVFRVKGGEFNSLIIYK
jgi:hypothetical protein